MKVNKYNRMVDSIFADNEDKRLHNLTSILVFMAITCMISFAANAIGKHFFYNSALMLLIPFVLFTIILFALGYTGYKQVFSYEDMIAVASAEVNAQQETANINKCMPRQDKLAERIILLAEDTTFFCSPNLRVNNLANLLGTNTRYVQKALNEETGMSFAEFINRKRVAHAEHLISKNPEMTMREASTIAGFVSTSAFYRNLAMYGKNANKHHKRYAIQ